MIHETHYICPMCGSSNTETYDRSFCDDGIKLWCNDCGFRGYVKSWDDLDSTTESRCIKAKKVRTRASRRRKDYVKALRKKRISDNYCGNYPYYHHLHQYSKNKIHCSCPLCASKSKDKAGYNLKISELRNMKIGSYKRQTAKLNRNLLNELEF